MKSFSFACILFLALAGCAASDFQQGLDAVDSGDFATALRKWKPLAEQGHARAQYHLGVMYHEAEGVPQDYAEAAIWYRKAADQGHAMAQNNLGFAYEKGQGVPQDYAEAVKWYRKSAEQGYARAENNHRVLYEKGHGNADAQAKLGIVAQPASSADLLQIGGVEGIETPCCT